MYMYWISQGDLELQEKAKDGNTMGHWGHNTRGVTNYQPRGAVRRSGGKFGSWIQDLRIRRSAVGVLWELEFHLN